jgi:hypothetical protein
MVMVYPDASPQAHLSIAKYEVKTFAGGRCHKTIFIFCHQLAIN